MNIKVNMCLSFFLKIYEHSEGGCLKSTLCAFVHTFELLLYNKFYLSVYQLFISRSFVICFEVRFINREHLEEILNIIILLHNKFYLSVHKLFINRSFVICFEVWF